VKLDIALNFTEHLGDSPDSVRRPEKKGLRRDPKSFKIGSGDRI
jgi:hypothetical protein